MTDVGRRQDGPAFRKIKPIRGELPALSEDWLGFLGERKAEIVRHCTHCSGESLCIQHSNEWEWEIRMARANVPVRYWPLEIENTVLEPQPAFTFIKNAIQNVDSILNQGLSFSLFGANGCGKTTLTLYFLKEVLRKGYSGYFTLMESLVTLIKDSFDRPELREKFNVIKIVKVLVLDDLGKEYKTNSGFVEARLDELLRWRDYMRLSTIFSSNLDGNGIKSRYGSGVISILSGTNRPMQVKGGDLRPSLDEWRGIR